MTTLPIIYNYELSNNRYSIEILEYNIDRLSLKRLLLTQHLSPNFCLKYLLNSEEYGMCNEDSYITKTDILTYQKHISVEDLM